MSYALRKFQGAVLELAGPETQRDRLINAYRLNLAHLDSADMPKAVWPIFESFRQKITRMTPQTDDIGRVATTVNTAGELEIKGLIEEVFALYESLIRAEYPSN